MVHYTYRCIPAHIQTPSGSQANLHITAAAWTYDTIAKQMAEGFEFQGSHPVHTWRPAGCLGWLFGQRSILVTTTVLVFRRAG